MLLLFVVEVMNLFWVLVLVLTVVVIAEKILPWGLLMSKALGGVLLAAAAYLAISAYFSPHGERHGQPRHGLYGRRLTRLSSPSLKSHKLLWLEWTRGRLPRSPRTPAW